ncbi:MAG TPA: GNAT family N-acetyltransferase [Conexibacter sp.]|jgi:ribosomal protein S18 acetylase RimI-like enzyme|nr:GNAT family N-acetyltransferase [Conexibacter sp.]
MALPAGVRLHHPGGTDEDAVTVLVLTTACQVADTGRSDRELADVIEDWDRIGGDLARDAWLAEDSGGETIGYAFVAPPDAEVRVHPRARGRGIGSHLRELVEARASERGAGELRQRVVTGDRIAERPLELAGYVPMWQTWRLERPLDVAPEPPSWPAGVTDAALDDERDVAEVLALLERSAASGPDGAPLALDRFHAEHLADERLDAGLCVLARRRERLVGAAICESWNDTDGSVVQLAVDPDERFDAIGRSLLLAAFAHMRERGVETVVVSVGGDGARIPEPYASVGLRPVWQQTTWRKALD